MSSMKAVQVIISGRVQGVGFRAWTRSNARKLALCGWVRNRRDGTVEAVFSGKTEAVDTMIHACKDGPLASRVMGIEVKDWPELLAGSFEEKETV